MISVSQRNPAQRTGAVFSQLRNDIRVIFERDPAARSTLEVIFTYPGLHALWFHRLSHWL